MSSGEVLETAAVVVDLEAMQPEPHGGGLMARRHGVVLLLARGRFPSAGHKGVGETLGAAAAVVAREIGVKEVKDEEEATVVAGVVYQSGQWTIPPGLVLLTTCSS